MALAVAGSGAYATAAAASVLISEEQFGERWPFTVAAGELRCEQHAVVFHAEGTDYAVNDLASARGYAAVEPIWRPSPVEWLAEGGVKVSIGPIIDRGLTLCGDR